MVVNFGPREANGNPGTRLGKTDTREEPLIAPMTSLGMVVAKVCGNRLVAAPEPP